MSNRNELVSAPDSGQVNSDLSGLPIQTKIYLTVFKPSLMGVSAAATVLMVATAFAESFFFDTHGTDFLIHPFPLFSYLCFAFGLIVLLVVVFFGLIAKRFDRLFWSILGYFTLAVAIGWFALVGISKQYSYPVGEPQWVMVEALNNRYGYCSDCVSSFRLLKLQLTFADGSSIKSAKETATNFRSCMLLQRRGSFSDYNWFETQKTIDLNLYPSYLEADIFEIQRLCLDGSLSLSKIGRQNAE